MPLRILIDREGDRVRDHARKTLRAQQRAEDHPRNAGSIVPRGVPIHQAHYPDTCAECGQVYWSPDPYAPHMYCPGTPPKHRAGFS